MSVINIRRAEREGARLVIGIAGVSGSGKTYTALELAMGLANGDASKVGLLDTENRRGSLYADKFPGILIGDLYAPFSPSRYTEAILEFAKAGVEVLVIDSATHEWEGVGGCEEIAANAKKIVGWKIAKAEHKKFMNAALTSPMHIIMCFRAREKTDFTDQNNPRSLGLQPITEKNVMFEMTLSLMMWDQGKAHQMIKPAPVKLPVIGSERGYITRKDGEALRAWVGGAKQVDPDLDRARGDLQTATQRGMKALEAAWKALTQDQRTALNDELAGFKSAAKAFDEPVPVPAEPESVARFNEEEDGF